MSESTLPPPHPVPLDEWRAMPCRLPFSLRDRRTWRGGALLLDNGDRLRWAHPVPGGAVLVVETEVEDGELAGTLIFALLTRQTRVLKGVVFPLGERERAVVTAEAAVAWLQERTAKIPRPGRRHQLDAETWLHRQLEGLNGGSR